MATKRSAEVPTSAEAGGGGPAPAPGRAVDTLEVTPLGAGSEVGRSCILLSYKGKNVLLDCGIHPGLSGIASLPYFDEIDLAKVRARASRRVASAARRLPLRGARA
jgi:cleavage and polyadenylation specificity factor subunit 3